MDFIGRNTRNRWQFLPQVGPFIGPVPGASTEVLHRRSSTRCEAALEAPGTRGTRTGLTPSGPKVSMQNALKILDSWIYIYGYISIYIWILMICLRYFKSDHSVMIVDSIHIHSES